MEAVQVANFERAGAPTRVWVGRVLSGLAIAFLAFDAAGKLFLPAPVVEGSIRLGYDPKVMVPLGIVLGLATIAYAVPRTSVLGAVLLTGWLGGAIATHVRVGNPLLSHTLFPIYVALFVWGGLFLRQPALRRIFPVRRLDNA